MLSIDLNYEIAQLDPKHLTRSLQFSSGMTVYNKQDSTLNQTFKTD